MYCGASVILLFLGSKEYATYIAEVAGLSSTYFSTVKHGDCPSGNTCVVRLERMLDCKGSTVCLCALWLSLKAVFSETSVVRHSL